MTHEDLKILNAVSARICGYRCAVSGDRSMYRLRCIAADRTDSNAMADVLRDTSDPSSISGGSHDRRAFIGL